MKVGVKVFYSSGIKSYLNKIIDKLDFYETMAVVGRRYHKFRELNMPCVIHCEHDRWNVNLANPRRRRRNRNAVHKAIEVADELDAKHIIVHPGIIENEECCKEQVVDMLREFKDKRIILENVPVGTKGIENVGYSYEEMEYLLKKSKSKMLLDFPHAAESAAWRGKNIVEFWKKMIGLKPAHYHLSDTDVHQTYDMHKHLGEGKLPLEKVKELIPKNAWVTLEVPHDWQKSERDLLWLKN